VGGLPRVHRAQILVFEGLASQAQKLAKALNSDEVRQFILTRYKGQIAPGF